MSHWNRKNPNRKKKEWIIEMRRKKTSSKAFFFFFKLCIMRFEKKWRERLPSRWSILFFFFFFWIIKFLLISAYKETIIKIPENGWKDFSFLVWSALFCLSTILIFFFSFPFLFFFSNLLKDQWSRGFLLLLLYFFIDPSSFL